MHYSYRYPWERIKKGEGFFIPCLNAAKVKKAGLNAALPLRIFDAKAYPAIHKGMSGVWFYR
jgi:hypothetical protein